MADFQGFTPETLDFLWGIRMNNNRDWFMAHKKQYTQTLYEPMKALARMLYQPFQDEPGIIMKVSRIYKDARMHPAEPYKDHLWLCMRQDVEWWAENPCIYFEIRPEGVRYGFCFWKPRADRLEDFRRDIAARPDPFLELIGETERAAGVRVTADLYKRPKPTEDPRLAPFFAWKGNISCEIGEDVGENLFDPGIGQRAKALFEATFPLMQYFCHFGA
ncbi:MAG: DUF2461 domain-containing protein [Faecousia sp.]